jgi:transposase
MSKNPYYKKVEVDKRRGPKPRKNFDANGGVKCKICFEMRNKNEELQIEITRLRLALEKALGETTKTPVGAHTPSSRIDYKANSKEESRLKRGGAKNGHKGFGRKSVTVALADDVIILPMTEKCESCDSALKIKDMRTRTIVESVPVIAKKVIYQCPRGTCPKCKKIYATSPPAMKKCLYGNSLVSQAAVLHYFHGITMGKALSLFGANVTAGGLVDSFHRLGRIAQLAKPYLVDEYRKANARHADETGWRTDGHSGYAWLFCTSKTSIFEFRDSRSSSVAREVLGEDKLDGVLNVDRYGGYNKMPVQLQYCFAHLLREVEKLEKEFPELGEVSHFVSSFSLLLAKAMKLRNQPKRRELRWKVF